MSKEWITHSPNIIAPAETAEHTIIPEVAGPCIGMMPQISNTKFVSIDTVNRPLCVSQSSMDPGIGLTAGTSGKELVSTKTSNGSLLTLELKISAAVGGKEAANLESMSELRQRATMRRTKKMAVCGVRF